jgi:hypothetical protein
MTIHKNRLAALKHAIWLVPAVAFVVAGCDDTRATYFEPVGALGFNAAIAPVPTGLPGGSVSTVGGDTIAVTLTGLRALQGGVYKIWGATNTGTAVTITPLAGRLVEYRLRDSLVAGDTVRDATDAPIQVPDSTVIAANGAGTYAGSDSTREPITGATFTLDLADGSTVDPSTQTVILVSIETSASASSPGTSQFMWRRVGIVGDGSLVVGNYGGLDTVNAVSPLDYKWVDVGTGAATFRGGEVVINFTNIPRPPIGFYYVSGLIDANGATTYLDTLRSQFDGSDASLSRVSLANADVDQTLPNVAPLMIKFSSVRNCNPANTALNCQNTLAVPDANPFGAMAHVALMLEPKLASSKLLSDGHQIMLYGDVPAPAQQAQ